MRIVLEKPITWLESDRDGDRNRLMYDSLTGALKALDRPFEEEPVHLGSDFVPRTAPEAGLRLAYHSVGNARNVWRIKETPFPYYYGIDRLGYSGWSELSVRPELHKDPVHDQDEQASANFCAGLSDWLKANNLSKYSQSSRTEPLPARFVFLPMQVATDVVARHNRLDPVAVLRCAARHAKRYGMPLVVKRHPYCRSWRVAAWLNWLALTNRSIQLTKASVTHLLPACSAVLVGNSGVGLEALAYSKPVYSFAASEYDLAAFAIHSLADLEAVFSTERPAPHPLGNRFVRYYLSECCFDARDTNDTREKISRVLCAAEEGHWLPEVRE